MLLMDILSMVAAIASGQDISMMSSIESYKMADIARNVVMKRQGRTLSFHRQSKGFRRAKTDYFLLSSDLKFAPYIIFTYQYKTWFAEQTTSPEVFERMLRFKDDEKSLRIAIIGANQINNNVGYSVEVSNVLNDKIYTTIMVSLTPSI